MGATIARYESWSRAGWAACLSGALVLAAAGDARAQARDQAIELDIARELMELELAGWRLPDPVEECLTGLALRRLEPMAFGAEELIEHPQLVDPPGPHFRNLRVDPEPGDSRRLVARFQWLGHDPTGRPQVRDDSLAFVINDLRGGKAAVSVVREPNHMVVRRECFGG
jgi:hypothetical protein